MKRFMPKLTARRVLAGTLVAALAGVPLAASNAAGAAQTIPRCPTAGLEVWLGVGAGGGQAGSVSYPMELTNVSGRTCHLFGFPGVSAVAGGHQAGSPAGRDHSASAQTVTVHPGATAHTVLQIADVSAFPPATCRPVTADGLRGYPPGAFRSAVIPFRFRACSAKGAAVPPRHRRAAAGGRSRPSLDG